ncbi:MAG TPA: hypothetical protein GXX39_06485 [Syntrophothermus lipocalidus]|uniref:RND related barrel-sandwich hybrid domain-containing protein n=1 Tax=Syntrophothermus lipocalidus (strain DSM 12680 / TGB-C1) TaxID=643648 RepID=D7CLL2_SYNLT|nr:HlyD family efflux transporter periplasmic adaptor subunit [Syntrophothermus lipocalidus]ADI01597.1 conserved hypothetical protein [Syntrophothermus lipocalidus DSM 12680]HHV76994.1 hypothetical protein [Syntrophothermus lipocalidus]
MSERLDRLAKQKKQKRLILKLLFVLVLISAMLAVAAAYRAVTGKLSVMRMEVEESKEGVLEETLTGTAMVVQEETVLRSPADGRFENLVREKERVRRGAILGRLYTESGTESYDVTAPIAGVVLYQTDGLETVMVPSKLGDLHPQMFAYSIHVVRGVENLLHKGDAFAKIVNNLKPTGLVVKTEDTADPLADGQEVGVRYKNLDLGTARVISIERGNDYTLVGLIMSGFVMEVADRRSIPVELVIRRYEGIIVPTRALTTKAGRLGVYCLRKETVVFKEVQLVARKAGHSVVRGLDAGEYVVTTPDLVKEGMVMRR